MPLTPTVLAMAAWLVILVLVIAFVAIGWHSRRSAGPATSAPADPDPTTWGSSAYGAALRAWFVGRLDPAEAHLRGLLRGNPHHVDAALLLGRILRRRGRYAQATWLHRQLQVRSDLSTRQRADVLAARLGDGLAGGVRAADLAPLADELLVTSPAHPLGLEVRVEACLERGDLRGVERAFRQAERHRRAVGPPLREAPARAPGGDASRRAADGDRLGRRLALILCRRADQLARAGEHAAARRHYRLAMRHDEHHPAPCLGLAALAAARGEEREALRWHRRAAERGRPELVVAELESLASRRADGLIEELARRQLARVPEDHAARHALIRLHRRHGEDAQALALIREGVAAGDRSPWVLRLGAGLLRKLRSSDEALQLLVDALPAAGRPWACHRCGRRAAVHAWRCGGCGAWDTIILERTPQTA